MERLNYRTLVLITFMLIIVAIRVIAPLSPDFKFLANLSGLGAIALFGGAYFKKWSNALLLPVSVLLASDLGLMFTMGKDYGFYDGWQYTYIAFILMVLVGRLMINKVNVQHVVGAGLVGVLIHWIVSDFGIWYSTTFYAKTLGGFWTCLVAAIPYELNFLYGTLAYAAIMFGAFEALKMKYPVLSLNGTREA
ncbi:MAG: DUF6580 family putative transport protein [Pedobacter sp.]|nr:DUF6580 family putative transport protein [Pedobacter sp.]MDQ8052044.1 DUF6580 family putative transport protein [Pedobacter sp.]